MKAAKEARGDAGSPAGGAGGLQEAAGGEGPRYQGQHPGHLNLGSLRLRAPTD